MKKLTHEELDAQTLDTKIYKILEWFSMMKYEVSAYTTTWNSYYTKYLNFIDLNNKEHQDKELFILYIYYRKNYQQMEENFKLVDFHNYITLQSFAQQLPQLKDWETRKQNPMLKDFGENEDIDVTNKYILCEVLSLLRPPTEFLQHLILEINTARTAYIQESEKFKSILTSPKLQIFNDKYNTDIEHMLKNYNIDHHENTNINNLLGNDTTMDNSNIGLH